MIQLAKGIIQISYDAFQGGCKKHHKGAVESNKQAAS
jgi:hypothetical protein